MYHSTSPRITRTHIIVPQPHTWRDAEAESDEVARTISDTKWHKINKIWHFDGASGSRYEMGIANHHKSQPPSPFPCNVPIRAWNRTCGGGGATKKTSQNHTCHDFTCCTRNKLRCLVSESIFFCFVFPPYPSYRTYSNWLIYVVENACAYAFAWATLIEALLSSVRLSLPFPLVRVCVCVCFLPILRYKIHVNFLPTCPFVSRQNFRALKSWKTSVPVCSPV